MIASTTVKCVHQDEYCRHCKTVSDSCHSSKPNKKPKSCQRSRPVLVTVLVLVSLLLDLSTVAHCLPVRVEIPSQSMSKHHQCHHHFRHQLHRDRSKHLSKLVHLESVEALDTSGSLSIVTPLDVLRQNMIMEIQRKRLRDATEKQVKYNTEFLDRIG